MSPDITSNKELVRRLTEDVWNEGQIEEVDDLLAPDFTGRGFGPQDLDRAGYKHFVSEHREIFPDLEFLLEDVLGEDDRVAVRWIRNGTQEKSIMDVEPTGNQISVSGMTIYRIVDNAIAEAWNIRDTVAMLQQLGLVPDQLPG
jgi:steroid delta-isomerase-like uncharacterized protein